MSASGTSEISPVERGMHAIGVGSFTAALVFSAVYLGLVCAVLVLGSLDAFNFVAERITELGDFWLFLGIQMVILWAMLTSSRVGNMGQQEEEDDDEDDSETGVLSKILEQTVSSSVIIVYITSICVVGAVLAMSAPGDILSLVSVFMYPLYERYASSEEMWATPAILLTFFLAGAGMLIIFPFITTFHIIGWVGNMKEYIPDPDRILQILNQLSTNDPVERVLSAIHRRPF